MSSAAPDEERTTPLLAALDRVLLRLAPPHTGAAPHEGGELPHELWKRALFGPAAEFLRRPGKEFRGRLTQLVWRGVGGGAELPHALPCITELLHAGSLIVDDVEDDSAQRRGAPALHKLVGAPLAINTGTWMYFWALSLIDELPLPEAVRGELSREAVAAMMRCHQGQALDLSIHIGHVEPRHVPAAVAATTRNKTGVLMGLAPHRRGRGRRGSRAHRGARALRRGARRRPADARRPGLDRRARAARQGARGPARRPPHLAVGVAVRRGG